MHTDCVMKNSNSSSGNVIIHNSIFQR